MEGKRNRGEVTAELSEKVWARLCRENALVASEVWVDDASRVDFVAYRPHRPRDRSSNHATAAELESGTFTFVEVKSCMDDFTSGHGKTFEGDENWLVCPLELADSLASNGMLPKGAAVYSPDAYPHIGIHTPRHIRAHTYIHTGAIVPVCASGYTGARGNARKHIRPAFQNFL